MSLLQDMKDLAGQWDQVVKEGQKNPSKQNEEKRKDLEFQLFMLQNKQGIEILNLTSRLNYYKEEYHKGSPKISDEEWDKLYFELYYLEKQSGIVAENSPTRDYFHSDKKIDQIQQVENKYKITDTNIVRDLNTVIKFCNNQPVDITIYPNGLNCFLTYKNGQLILATVEDLRNKNFYDITDFALAISPVIPRRIENNENLVIQGRLTCLTSNFQKLPNYNKKSIEDYLMDSLKSKDTKTFIGYHINFFATDVLSGLENLDTYRNKITRLNQYGFSDLPSMLVSQFDNSLLNLLKVNAEKKKLSFSLMKFKFNQQNNQSIQQEIFYQFFQEHYQRPIQNITWDFNLKDDILIPYGRINTIFYNNLNFRHIQLPVQQAELKKMFFGKNPVKNQKLNIYKTNQLSPKIISVEKIDINNPPKNSKELLITPIYCPYCGTKIEIFNNNQNHSDYDNPDFEYLICNNKFCSGKFINKIKHFFGKDGLDIQGFSDETLEWLILEKQWITCYKDIYTLNKYQKEWELENGYDKKIVNNLLNAIEESKKCSLADFLSALSIPSIDKQISIKLAKYFKTYENFSNSIQNNNIINVVNDEESLVLTDEQIQNLLDFNYMEFDYLWKVFKYGEEIPYDKNYFYMPLRQKTYVVIGPVKYFDSVEWLCGYIHGEGGAAVTQVTENVDYVINNDPESDCPENIAARELGIPIITEQEFLSNIY